MTWLILTLSSIILWGITDILLKKSLDYTDSLSQYKTFIWIGLVAFPASVIMAIYSDTLLDSIRIVAHNPYIIPVNIIYVVASFFGLLGAKHLDASVVSPLENIDRAVTAIILYMFFAFTGRSHVTDSTEVFFILCDDTEREHGNISKAEKIASICTEYGWQTISMKNDWTTIYGNDVCVVK